MTKLIKDKFNTILSSISAKKEISEAKNAIEKTKVIGSKSSSHDEYGYFNRLENL